MRYLDTNEFSVWSRDFRNIYDVSTFGVEADFNCILNTKNLLIKDIVFDGINALLIHTSEDISEKSTILNEHTLRQFAGWSPGSNIHLKYLHYFGNESNDSILEAYGIISKGEQLSEA